jgi:hypothetical protein
MSFDKTSFKRKKINDAFKKLIHPSIPDLHFSDKEILYISNPFDSKFRNKWLSSVSDIHHICDAYACIGGDSIQFMAIKPSAIIDIIQITDPNDPILSLRFHYLNLNISASSFLNPNVHIFPSSISHFILNSISFHSVDFLYCDPPWTDSNDIWFDSPTLISNLNHDIFQHLNYKNYNPLYICFKVPFHWSHFKSILSLLPSYLFHASFKFHFNGYWIHIIKTNKQQKIP